MTDMKRKLNLPRVPLPRQTGGAHGGAKPRELSAREELTLRLNEMENERRMDAEELKEWMVEEDSEDYFDYLLSKIEAAGGSRW